MKSYVTSLPVGNALPLIQELQLLHRTFEDMGMFALKVLRVMFYLVMGGFYSYQLRLFPFLFCFSVKQLHYYYSKTIPCFHCLSFTLPHICINSFSLALLFQYLQSYLRTYCCFFSWVSSFRHSIAFPNFLTISITNLVWLRAFINQSDTLPH